jgi:DNA-damage-inducible protein D
MKNKYVNFF